MTYIVSMITRIKYLLSVWMQNLKNENVEQYKRADDKYIIGFTAVEIVLLDKGPELQLQNGQKTLYEQQKWLLTNWTRVKDWQRYQVAKHLEIGKIQ